MRLVNGFIDSHQSAFYLSKCNRIAGFMQAALLHLLRLLQT